MKGNVAAVQWLAKNHFSKNIDVKCKKGRTALQDAVFLYEKQYTEFRKTLNQRSTQHITVKRSNDDVNKAQQERDKEIAETEGTVNALEIINTLIQNGANPFIRNKVCFYHYIYMTIFSKFKINNFVGP